MAHASVGGAQPAFDEIIQAAARRLVCRWENRLITHIWEYLPF